MVSQISFPRSGETVPTPSVKFHFPEVGSSGTFGISTSDAQCISSGWIETPESVEVNAWLILAPYLSPWTVDEVRVRGVVEVPQ